MAKTNGIISISGTIGDLTFANRDGNPYLREKHKGPIKQTEATKRTAAEFKIVVKLTSRLYKLLIFFVKNYGKPAVRFRLQTLLQHVYKSIPAIPGDHKQLMKGNIKLLEGLRFNEQLAVNSLLYQLPFISIDREKGVRVKFETCEINSMFKTVNKAKLAAVKVQVVVLNLDDREDEMINANPLLINLNSTVFKGGTLNIPLEFVGSQLLVLCLGVHYLDENSIIDNRKYKAAEIIYAQLLQDGQPVTYQTPAVSPKRPIVEEEGLDWEV